MQNDQKVDFIKWFIRNAIIAAISLLIIYYYFYPDRMLGFYFALVVIGLGFVYAIIMRAVLIFFLKVKAVRTSKVEVPGGRWGGFIYKIWTSEEAYVLFIIFGTFLILVPGQGAVIGIPLVIISLLLLVRIVIKRAKTIGQIYFIYVIPLKKGVKVKELITEAEIERP